MTGLPSLPPLRRTTVLPWLLLLVGGGGTPARAIAQVPHPLLDRMAGVVIEGESLEDALAHLRQATGIGLVYSPDLLPPDLRVSCPCLDRTVREALDILLRGTGLTFTATSSQVRIAPPRPQVGDPRTGTVGGTVVSAEDGSPIGSALVELGKGRGGLTNENGSFILLNVPPGVYSLRVSSLGWDTQEMAAIEVVAGETVSVEFRLQRRVIPLSALVIAPGTFGILDQVQDFALQSLTREEIETVPQLGEDVFRSLRRLPGVASDDISTRLYLRGGTDREVLMLLDGMELYEPYHLKDFDGALGIVDLNAIGGIDLHAGGFPVDFGNHLTGVFDMRTRTPPPDQVRTTLGLSITNASFLSQGHFDRGRGQWLVSSRRGYMDIAFRLTDIDKDIKPRYYDALAKVQYQVGEKHLLSLHILQAGDRLWLDPDAFGEETSDGRLKTAWDNSYAWLTWKAYLTPRARGRTLVSAGRVTRRRMGFVEEPGRVRGPEAGRVSDEATFHFLGIKEDWTVDLADRVALRAGASVRGLFGDYDYDNWTRSLVASATGEVVGREDSTRVRMDPSSTEAGAFAALRVQPIPWLTTELGIRYDRFAHTGDSDVSPRLGALLQLGEHTTLRAGIGEYHQSQGIHELEAGDGETEFTPSEAATQVAAGLEHVFRNGTSARVEAYQRRIRQPRRFYSNLWREILPFPELDGDRYRVVPERGRASGLELMARSEGERWDWSAGYALSSSELRVDGDWIPQFWDQTHALSVTVGYHPSERWTLTGAWQIHSGWPFTPRTFAVDTVTVFQGDGSQWHLWWRQEFGTLNGTRLPAYHRLDLRINRSFQLRRGTLDVYFDLFNAYNQENLRSVDYRLELIGNHLTQVQYPDETLLPFLPSIGVRWEF